MTLKVKVIKVTLFSTALEDNGLSDPYIDVELRVSGSSKLIKHTTAIIYKTSHPVRIQEFTFHFPGVVPARSAEVCLS
jgi:ribosomal protein L10